MANNPPNVLYHDLGGYYRFQGKQRIELLDQQVYDLGCKSGKGKVNRRGKKVGGSASLSHLDQKRAMIRRQLKSQYRAPSMHLSLRKTTKYL